MCTVWSVYSLVSKTQILKNGGSDYRFYGLQHSAAILNHKVWLYGGRHSWKLQLRTLDLLLPSADIGMPEVGLGETRLLSLLTAVVNSVKFNLDYLVLLSTSSVGISSYLIWQIFWQIFMLDALPDPTLRDLCILLFSNQWTSTLWNHNW